ncbi:putative ribonuclease H-like domain-containing protein [Tanacetum coccineum]
MDDTGIFDGAYDDEDVEEEVDMNNVISSYIIPDAPFTKFHKDHPEDQTLVDLPRDKLAIGTKWVFRNKKDERGIVVKNKARLVAQGHTQEEDRRGGLCLLASSFEDLDFPDKVYKVEKALYGLHQAPRAWYETLSTYFLDNGFNRVPNEFYGELSFFLGLQVQQKSDGIFISQDKYVADILKKFNLATVKTASTPMEPNKALTKDEEVEDVDVHLYRSMIGSLMYLTTSRPDIMFVVCTCARFQVTPKTLHLHALKRIFRYIKGQSKLGLLYPRDSPFNLEAYSDSDYAGASLDNKIHNRSLSGPIHLVADETVHKEWGDKMERAATTASSLEVEQDSAKVKTVNGECQIQALVDKKKVIITETSIRSDLHLEDECGTDCLPTATIFKELERIGRVTPLLATMMVQANQEMGEDSAIHTDSQQTPITTL